MANFFDRVADAINNTADNITEKAKDFSEVSSLNAQIHSQQKVLDNAYREIGIQYYKLHKDDTQDAFLAQMKIITEAKTQIEKLKTDISNIKNN